MVLWSSGKLLVWDATCIDTFAPSYIAVALSEVGAVAVQAGERKASKYSHLSRTHIFSLVVMEATGVIGPKTLAFLKDLGCRVRLTIGEEKSYSYLIQRMSLAVQRETRYPYLGRLIRYPYLGRLIRYPYLGRLIRYPYLGRLIRDPYLGRLVRYPYLGQLVFLVHLTFN